MLVWDSCSGGNRANCTIAQAYPPLGLDRNIITGRDAGGDRHVYFYKFRATVLKESDIEKRELLDTCRHRDVRA